MRVYACKQVYTHDFCPCETHVEHVSYIFNIELLAGLYCICVIKSHELGTSHDHSSKIQGCLGRTYVAATYVHNSYVVAMVAYLQACMHTMS